MSSTRTCSPVRPISLSIPSDLPDELNSLSFEDTRSDRTFLCSYLPSCEGYFLFGVERVEVGISVKRSGGKYRVKESISSVSVYRWMVRLSFRVSGFLSVVRSKGGRDVARDVN